MNINYTEEQLEIVSQFAQLLAIADAAGLVVEIERVSLPPLAMGHHLPLVKVSKSRAAYTAEVACKSH